MSDASAATLPEPVTRPDAPATPSLPAARFLLGWMAAWAGVGVFVALAIVFATDHDLRPVLLLSVPFSLVVGLTAFTAARLVFPLFEKLPFVARLLLEVLTVLSGALFGSAAVIWMQPLFIAAQLRTVGLIVAVNAALALIVGLALNTYDNLKRQIEQSYQALREKEALERELGIAREVQQHLLPREVPDVAGLELAGACITAVGVGGDYFDYLPVDDNQVGLVVADISGKGFPAALLMAGLQAAVRSQCSPAPQPGPLNVRLNAQLYETSSDARYATLFLAFYDTTTHSLRYSNAGHLPPLLIRGDEVQRLERGGMPIGMFPEVEYDEGQVELRSGDLLALFTDGVLEAPRAGGEEFGEQRLLDLLLLHRERPLDEIVRLVLEALESWAGQGTAHDDVTLLMARAQ